jgi:serine/alanine adding enzyme
MAERLIFGPSCGKGFQEWAAMDRSASRDSGANPRGGEIKVDLLGPAEDRNWDDYVGRHPQGTVYHLCGWRQVIRDAYGHRDYYLVARHRDDPAGQVTGVLPLIGFSHILFGARLVSMPFFDKGGVLADDPRIAEVLIDRAIALGRQLGAGVIELRYNHPHLASGPERAEGSPARTIQAHKVGMELDLPGSADELWQSFRAKLRSQIRKPMKEGLTVRTGGIELLPPFYQVFAANMRDLGSPVHSRKLPAAVLRVFAESAAILVVFKKELPVAAGLVVGSGRVLANPWASALREHSGSSPNMLLYWAMLEFACRQGYAVFDFGRSTPGGGTYRFKMQWGAKEKPLAWERIHLRTGNRVVRTDSRRMRTAARCWRKLPISWSKVLGPLLRKHIDL